MPSGVFSRAAPGGRVCDPSPRRSLSWRREAAGPSTLGLVSPRLRKRLSVSESSHTESDSSPPLTVRRHCSGLLDVPRFPEGTEEAVGTPRRPQQEGSWLLTPPSGEGVSGPGLERSAERRLKLEEEPAGQSSAPSPGAAPRVEGLAGVLLGGPEGRLSCAVGLIARLVHSHGDPRRPRNPTAGGGSHSQGHQRPGGAQGPPPAALWGLHRKAHRSPHQQSDQVRLSHSPVPPHSCR